MAKDAQNCRTCYHEFQLEEHKPHKLCQTCWNHGTKEEAIVTWIKANVIDFIGNVHKNASNCPGWLSK